MHAIYSPPNFLFEKLSIPQTYAPKKTKGLSLGLGFQIFEYLCFGFGFRYFANLLHISNYIIQNKKKNEFLGMDLSINFDFSSSFLNLYSNPDPKIKNLFFIF